jgi:hypothetical protein
MALSKKNIIIGAARLFIGPATTTPGASSKPAYVNGQRYSTTLAGADGSTNTGVATLVTNWREVGYTMNGLAVANNPSWGEVQVDQLLDSAKIFKESMTFNVNTTLAETTLENILVAWGQASSSLTSSGTDREVVIQGGALNDPPLERGLIAVGAGTENDNVSTNKELVYQLYRVLSVDAVTATYSRSEAANLPVNFRCLPADDGNYGLLRERANVT